MTGRAGTFLLLLTVTLAGAWAAPAAGQAALPGSDGFVRVIDTVSADQAQLTVAADGVGVGQINYGSATPFQRTAAGSHIVTVHGLTHGDVSTSTIVHPGCYQDLVLGRPTGVDGPDQIVQLEECHRDRVPAGNSGVRLIMATPDVGAAALVANGADAPATAAPYRATARIDVPAGHTTIGIKGISSNETYADVNIDLAADTLWTAVYMGQGETPLTLKWFFDGIQPSEDQIPPPIVNTGDTFTGHLWPGNILQWLSFLVLALAIIGLVVARHKMAKKRAVLALAVALLLLVTTSCNSPRTTGAASVPVPVPPTGQPETTTMPPHPLNPEAPNRIQADNGRIDSPIVPYPASDGPVLNRVLPGGTVALLGGNTTTIVTLAGHTYFTGQGAFAHLPDLHTGDTVTTRSPTGTTIYKVRWVAAFDKGQLPSDVWAATTEPTAILITCTGDHNSQGLHKMNLIVYATTDIPIPTPTTPES